jgi:hypothetical protein
VHCEEIELDIEVEEEVEEDLEEEYDRWYVIIVNNQDTMHENVHVHLRHICIFVHHIMTQKIVQHCWGRSRRRGIKTIRMYNGYLQKLERMKEIST